MPELKIHASKEFQFSLREIQKQLKVNADSVPQLRDVSKYLEKKSGWQLKPTGGMLKPREFLNALAFKTYFAAPFLPHPEESSKMQETDLVQEILGTAPLLANPEVADFFQQLGLASLGANEAEV